MSMDSAPASGYIITTEELRKLVPAEYDAFMQSLSKASIELDDYSQEYIDTSTACEGVDGEFEALLAAFQAATTVNGECLELELFVYRVSDGGKYDGDDLVDGANWSVAGMTKLTKPGETFKDAIRMNAWTVYG